MCSLRTEYLFPQKVNFLVNAQCYVVLFNQVHVISLIWFASGEQSSLEWAPHLDWNIHLPGVLLHVS